MTIVVHNLTFKSKSQLKEFTKKLILEIIAVNNNKKSVLFDEDKSFFLELFKRHPEYERKAASGIEHVFLMKGNHIEIRRVDGTNETISWKTCCDSKYPSPSVQKAEIYRKIVKQDIANYRASLGSGISCANCMSKQRIQIDHCGEHEFKDIVRMFEQSGEKDFRKFHKKYAELQPLCEMCHKLKSNKASPKSCLGK